MVVRDGQVLAEGQNRVLVDHDPTAHAEVVALRRACSVVGDFALRGAILYSSCEPCPLCYAAACWARVERIVVAACAQDAKAAGFDDVFITEQLALPSDQRQVRVVQRSLVDAQLPFRTWQQKTDRVPY